MAHAETLLRRGRPNRPGGVVVGKTTHVWCPRVRGRPCYPELQRRVAVVACVGNLDLSWGNVRFHTALRGARC
eukprot:4022765-Prymnesium_polylepis.1